MEQQHTTQQHCAKLNNTSHNLHKIVQNCSQLHKQNNFTTLIQTLYTTKALQHFTQLFESL